MAIKMYSAPKGKVKGIKSTAVKGTVVHAKPTIMTKITAGRPVMQTSGSSKLEKKILGILQSGQAISLPDLEHRLKNKYDTFDVLMAVQMLMRQRKADYTTKRYIRII
jgi:hypothetical protein